MNDKETTATINLNMSPMYTVRNIVEVSDESIEKIADAVMRKLVDLNTELQTEKERASDECL